MNRKVMFLIVFLVIVGSTVFGENEELISGQLVTWLQSEKAIGRNMVDPLIEYLSGRINGQPLPWEELLDWALAFSTAGVPDLDQDLQERVHERVSSGISEIKAGTYQDTSELCQSISSYMYREFLREYSVDQDRVDEIILSDGRYNCISSAALYMIFATAFDLNVYGILTDTHAFIIVKEQNVTIQIETTGVNYCIEVYEGEFTPKYDEWFLVKNPVRFLSGILYNRAIRSEEKSDFSGSLSLLINLVEGIKKLPVEISLFNPTPEHFFVNRIQLYTDLLIETNKHQEAMKLLELASEYISDNAEFKNLVHMTLNNIAAEFINSSIHHPAEAFNILEFLSENSQHYLLDIERIHPLMKGTVRNTCNDIKKFYGGSAAAIVFVKNVIQNYGEFDGIREILLDEIIGYAIVLVNAGNNREAIDLLESEEYLFSEKGKWYEVFFTALNNYAVRFINSDCHLPEESEEILDVLTSKTKKYDFDLERMNTLVSQIVVNTALFMDQQQDDTFGAIRYLERVILRYGASERIEEIYADYCTKIGIAAHT